MQLSEMNTMTEEEFFLDWQTYTDFNFSNRTGLQQANHLCSHDLPKL